MYIKNQNLYIHLYKLSWSEVNSQLSNYNIIMLVKCCTLASLAQSTPIIAHNDAAH